MAVPNDEPAAAICRIAAAARLAASPASRLAASPLVVGLIRACARLRWATAGAGA